MIGAGAAGTMAAIFAAGEDADVLLLERTDDGGRKILISGGGRCNILPVREAPARFVTASPPRLLPRLLRSWPLREQVAFFRDEAGIPLAEEAESGKLFPTSNRARDVRDALFALARRRGVSIRTSALVTGLSPLDADGHARWRIAVDGSPHAEADAVVVATGGLSIPRSGSDGTGLAFLERLGHAVSPTYPALTPLIGPAPPAPASVFAGLAGVSLPVALTARSEGARAAAEGGFLFTHRGYSGPAVLDVSHVAVQSSAARLAVRWSSRDAASWESALQPDGSRTVAGVLRGELPHRLADALCALARVDPARSLSQLRREERLRLVETLQGTELPWSGHEGYGKAEVTGGGIRLDDVDPKTLESRRHPNLHLCGELLDAFGPIGGHNFQWAWATGRAAGLAAARRARP